MRKILLVDAHAIVRDGIMKILAEALGATAFGEASSAREALNLIHEQSWDVAMLDISLNGRSGLDVLVELRRVRPSLPVLVFSMHAEEQYARRALRAGASGYVTKKSPRTELIKAVQKVLDGGRYVSATLAERLAIDLERGSPEHPHDALSAREFEVMRQIASGKAVSEIAELLSLSAKTISTYRSRILDKLRLKNNAELTHYAIHAGLMD